MAAAPSGRGREREEGSAPGMLALRARSDVNSLRSRASGKLPLAMPDDVLYERIGAAAVITIDRQERRNAIDGPTAGLLTDAYERFVADGEARVLVITGAGELAFCAGADLKAIDTLGPRLELPEGPLGFTRLASPKPTIAAVSGWCLAGGFELALWCDLRVATPSARFGFTERRFGVPLIDGGTQRLPRIVGQGRGGGHGLCGPGVGGVEARRFGLITERVPAGGHVERALEMAEAIAAFPQDTLLSDRRAVLEGAGLPLVQGLALEERLGRGRQETALQGAARFAGGEGRGATGAGI
jgi:enoyl-CoA hydratase